MGIKRALSPALSATYGIHDLLCLPVYYVQDDLCGNYRSCDQLSFGAVVDRKAVGTATGANYQAVGA